MTNTPAETTYISDAVWAKVIEAEPRLPTESRVEFEEAVRSHISYNKDKTTICLRTHREKRANLRRIKSFLDRLSYETNLYRGSLNHSTESAEATSWDSYLATLGKMNATVQADEKGLRRRAPRNWQINGWRSKLMPLFVELLDIRSFQLKIDVPTQAAETVNSGRFHNFLRIFLQLVEPHAKRPELDEMLKAGIDSTVELNQGRRTDVTISWQWDELFPQTYRSLEKSPKFRAPVEW